MVLNVKTQNDGFSHPSESVVGADPWPNRRKRTACRSKTARKYRVPEFTPSNQFDESFSKGLEFLTRTPFRFCLRRLAAEKEVAAAAGRDCIGSAGTSAGMGRPRSHHHHHHHQQADVPPGPSSLFLFSTDNPVRRYTRFIIEWPYPFDTTRPGPAVGNRFKRASFCSSRFFSRISFRSQFSSAPPSLSPTTAFMVVDDHRQEKCKVYDAHKG